ncbi:UNVERIFIED_CONTAM: RNA-directed DNA polymerase [Sesamum radiatum]|uniref:RNA-directed DNA polymerase n=1 Tax=Sesamum radiatum TaxID=300843 RepID=A0AAW2VQF2_SESRA
MPYELPLKLPPKRVVDPEIELVSGTKPPTRAPYQISQPELVELRKQLKEILESDIIKPAKSPYGVPVLFQKKTDGSLRMYCDYRALIKITVKNKYPIPLVADCFDRLSRVKYLTKIDLRSGYRQVRIKERDETKTTTVTSGSLAEHVEHLWQVLTRLREHELYAKEVAKVAIPFLEYGFNDCKDQFLAQGYPPAGEELYFLDLQAAFLQAPNPFANPPTPMEEDPPQESEEDLDSLLGEVEAKVRGSPLVAAIESKVRGPPVAEKLEGQEEGAPPVAEKGPSEAPPKTSDVLKCIPLPPPRSPQGKEDPALWGKNE